MHWIKTIWWHGCNKAQVIPVVCILLLYNAPVHAQEGTIWADSCVTGSFYGSIVSEGYSDFSQVHACSNGDVILVGTIKRKFAQLEVQRNYCNVVRITADGSIVWSRFVGIVDPAIQVDLRAYTSTICTNGDVVIVLAVNAVPLSGNYVVRLNAAGKLQWQKRLPYLNNALFSDTFKDLIETSDGGLLVTGAASNDAVYLKLNSNGNMLWRRTLSSWTAGITAVTEGTTGYFIAGDFTNTTTGFVENFLAKADKNNGTITWLKWLVAPGTLPLTQVAEYELDHLANVNGMIAASGATRYNYAGPNGKTQVLLYTDEDGNVTSSKRIINSSMQLAPANIDHGRLINPAYQCGVQFNTSDSSDYYVYQLDNSQTSVPGWRILLPGAQSANDLIVQNDSSILIAGLTRRTGQSASASLLKTSVSRRLDNCSNSPVNLQTSSQQFTAVINTNVWTSVAVPATSETARLDTLAGKGFAWQLDCSNLSGCRMSKIQGEGAVCIGQSANYRVKRKGCGGMVTFTVNNTGATITNTSDSTVNIQFAQPGQYTVYATMSANCGLLKDSLLVEASNSNTTASLGADRELCAGNQATLRLSAPFRNYEWQDGSSDSIQIISRPGTYSVKATDACGVVLTDTVIVTAAPSVPFSITGSNTICQHDTLVLTATSGFTNYQWQPANQLTYLAADRRMASPPTDMTYTVTAERHTGCLLFDTIRVKVNAAPSINLGSDRSICADEAIVLNVGPEFVAYRWNDGSIAASLVVNRAGLYSVQAIDANGCIAADSIYVSMQNCAAGLFIPSAFSPNGEGGNEQFKVVTASSMERFSLQVFNRWGKQIFQSTTISNGWDGRVQGVMAEAGVYVWVCRYQLPGTSEMVKKGTVTLIR